MLSTFEAQAISREVSTGTKNSRNTEQEGLSSVPYIWVLNKLPSEAQASDYQYVPITTVLPNWKGLPTFSAGIEAKFDTTHFMKTLQTEFKSYFDNLQRTLDYFVLVDMGKYGKALFAKKDIPAGTKLLYCGHYCFSTEITKQSMYQFGLAEVSMNSQSAKHQMLKSGPMIIVDGNDYANYFQHLPFAKSPEYHFQADIKKVATANFKGNLEKITDQMGILSLEATDTIKEGSMTGFDYTLAYWPTDPAFFDKDGKELTGVTPYTRWDKDVLAFATSIVSFMQQLENKSEFSPVTGHD